MSRCVCDVSNMTLDELRTAGVASVEFGAGLTRIMFFETAIAPAVAAIEPTRPSTPEQSGKADPSEEPPKKDIFDVLSEGVIPGAPSRDGLAGTPGSS